MPTLPRGFTLYELLMTLALIANIARHRPALVLRARCA